MQDSVVSAAQALMDYAERYALALISTLVALRLSSAAACLLLCSRLYDAAAEAELLEQLQQVVESRI